MTNLEQYAQECAGNWKHFDSFGWHGKPDWADRAYMWNIEHRDSHLVDVSNAQAIREELEPFTELEQVEFHSARHWAYGWVDSVVVMVYDEDGNITDAFKKVVEIKERLENYPLLNEEDYCNREYEEQCESISDGLPDDLLEGLDTDDVVGKVFSWLFDCNQEALYYEDNWVDPKAIREACQELGLLEPEEEEVYCPVCDGWGNLLGTMGNLKWYRCEDCGVDFDIEVEQPVPAFQLQLECE